MTLGTQTPGSCADPWESPGINHRRSTGTARHFTKASMLKRLLLHNDGMRSQKDLKKYGSGFFLCSKSRPGPIPVCPPGCWASTVQPALPRTAALRALRLLGKAQGMATSVLPPSCPSSCSSSSPATPGRL